MILPSEKGKCVKLLDTGNISSQQFFPLNLMNLDCDLLMFSTYNTYALGFNSTIIDYNQFKEAASAQVDLVRIPINIRINEGRELMYGTALNAYHPHSIWNQPDQTKSTYSNTRYLIYAIKL